MKKLASLTVGVVFLAAVLGSSFAWAADMPSVPGAGAAGKMMEKATEKVEAMKDGEKEKKSRWTSTPRRSMS